MTAHKLGVDYKLNKTYGIRAALTNASLFGILLRANGIHGMDFNLGVQRDLKQNDLKWGLNVNFKL